MHFHSVCSTLFFLVVDIVLAIETKGLMSSEMHTGCEQEGQLTLPGEGEPNAMTLLQLEVHLRPGLVAQEATARAAESPVDDGPLPEPGDASTADTSQPQLANTTNASAIQVPSVDPAPAPSPAPPQDSLPTEAPAPANKTEATEEAGPFGVDMEEESDDDDEEQEVAVASTLPPITSTTTTPCPCMPNSSTAPPPYSGELNETSETLEPLPEQSDKDLAKLNETRTQAQLDCEVSEWSEWSDCINNKQGRSRTVFTPAATGGHACPDLQAFQTCTG
jgi:hypothetical protein